MRGGKRRGGKGREEGEEAEEKRRGGKGQEG